MAAVAETSEANAVGRALRLLGDQWTLLILQRAFMGTRKFQDWHRTLHLSESVLASRLESLVEEGLFERRPYFNGRTRHDYWLTESGLATWNLFVAIWAWEIDQVPGRIKSSPDLVHDDCGSATTPILFCGTCNSGPVTSRDTTASRDGTSHSLLSNPERRSRRAVNMSIEPNVLNPANETVEILGDRWVTGIVTACMFGVRRFADFERELKIAPSVLSDKLDRAVELGMLQKNPIVGTKNRFEYRLTDKGRAIFPVFTVLLHWAESSMGDLDNPRVRITHGSDRHRFTPILVCSVCERRLERSTTRFRISD